MWVNNETGMVLPVAALADLASGPGVIVHTDASQAVGKVRVDVSEVRVDLLTATGHKIYGPKGTGLLFVRKGTPLSPLLHGGGQERAIRPGTQDVAGAVGLATALMLAWQSLERESVRLSALRDRLEERLSSELEGIRVNAGSATRAPHVSSIGIRDVPDGQALLMALDLEGVAVSGGSACASGSQRGSHVIAALYGPEDPYANVRFSFGRGSTEAQVERAVAATVEVVQRVRVA
jgi:cysteine desulfurase